MRVKSAVTMALCHMAEERFMSDTDDGTYKMRVNVWKIPFGNTMHIHRNQHTSKMVTESDRIGMEEEDTRKS